MASRSRRRSQRPSRRPRKAGGSGPVPITLCVIARDEEAMLPGCLASVRDAVDAVVVVDTGSVDATAEIARRAGATLVDHAWRDDFAAARNAALDAVERGFVLVLDADERLAPGAASPLRAAVQSDVLDLGMLPLHNASRSDATPAEVLSGSARLANPMLLPRLLRRTPDLQWEGVVHESVVSWASAGRRIVAVDAPIVHYGAVPTHRDEQGKADRNRRLLERHCAAGAEDAASWTHLAAERDRAGDAAGALTAAQQAWQRIARAHAAGDRVMDAIFPATLLVLTALKSRRLDLAADTLARCREWRLDHPNLDFLAAALGEERARAGHAVPVPEIAAGYRRCLDRAGEIHAAEVIPGATTWLAATRLGEVELAAGRPAAALAAFDAAIETGGGSVEARLGRIEAMLECGDPAAALQAIEPLLAGTGPDAWLLAALAAERLGARTDARLFARRARELSRDCSFLTGRRSALLDGVEGAVTGGGLPGSSPLPIRPA